MRPFPRLLWAELSCTGGLSTIQAPVLAETHAQEGARQGKRRRRRRKRKRRCWFSWLLSTFFRYGLLEGCRSLQVRALTLDKDRTAVHPWDWQRGGWSSSPQGPWASVALVYFRRCYWKHKTKCLEGTIKNRRNMGDSIIQWVFMFSDRGEGRGNSTVR